MNDSSKELCKWFWDKLEMDGQSMLSNVTLHKKFKNQLFLAKMTHNYFHPLLHWGHLVWACNLVCNSM